MVDSRSHALRGNAFEARCAKQTMGIKNYGP